jgi:hypothetical protein
MCDRWRLRRTENVHSWAVMLHTKPSRDSLERLISDVLV